MKIAIGNDHAAVDMKKELIPFLESLGHEVVNFGTDTKESTLCMVRRWASTLQAARQTVVS